VRHRLRLVPELPLDADQDSGVVVRPLTGADQPWKDASLRRTWGSTSVARRGVLLDAGALPGFIAMVDEFPVGLLTYAHKADDIEVATLHVEHESRGVGQALMDSVLTHAREAGARRLWLITTNDNIRAICFYQQWGMELVALHRDAVVASRRMKPSIAQVGDHGIPVRHELEFEVRLG
jgi:ribosomal protein S18 acetylase RimI-like enzyme